MQKKYFNINYVLAILGLSFLSIGCSKASFQIVQQTNLNSDNNPSSTPTTTKIIVYPSYAKIFHSPSLYEQTIISVEPQSDDNTCDITATVSPMDLGLCADIPDLCWQESIAKVDRTNDITCAQAYKAKDIKVARGGQACVLSSQTLSVIEVNQINDPQIYALKSESMDPSISPSNMTGNLPSIKSIVLDTSCRCDYLSNDLSSFTYKIPALEDHCRAHFPEIYK